jgi:hypothetical protein
MSKLYSFLFFPFLSLVFNCSGQEVILVNGGSKSCPMSGTAKPHTHSWNKNLLKNRYDFEEDENIEPEFTMENLVNYYYDSKAFDQETAGDLTGYIITVKSASQESCNCYADYADERDTHIEMVLDKKDQSAGQIVIIEVTPRMRAIMAKKGIDWSTKALKKKFLGKKVTASGWLFFDHEHVNESTDSDPNDVFGRKNWRATCWELHPVTSIELAQ